MDKYDLLFYNNKIVVKIIVLRLFMKKNLFFCRKIEGF